MNPCLGRHGASDLTRNRWAAIGAAFIAASACGTAPEPNVSSQPQWDWRTACCGFAGDERTPETEGYSYVLQFDSDGRVRAFRDGQPTIETRYRLTISGGGPLTDQAVTVEYDDPLSPGPGIEPASRQLVVLLEGSGLLLRNLASCADCYRDWTFLPSLAH